MITAAEILNASVLIVDDQPSNVLLLEEILREAGYTRVSSTMDPHAVAALHRQNRYDLILLDLKMPGMDGFQVMENLKAIETESYIPVLVVTAEPGHKLRALQAGAKDFVSKPFDLTEVKTRIHNMLEVRLLYRRLDNYNKLLEQTVQERTAQLRESEARFRALTELASDWYWESRRKPARHQGIRSDSRHARDTDGHFAGGNKGTPGLGLERGGARRTRSKHQGAATVPRFPLQPGEARRLPPILPGQRRTDIRPLRPLHRLSRHRRGSDRAPVHEPPRRKQLIHLL